MKSFGWRGNVAILDIGAHKGESMRFFRKVVPKCRLHVFEPVEDNFRELEEAWGGKRGVHLNQLAMSDQESQSSFFPSGNCDSGRLETPERDAKANQRAPVLVSTMTVDTYLSDLGLNDVALMKIDTEGHDLRVLKGAERALAQGKVAAVIVEASMSPRNQFHVPFQDFQNFFEDLGGWHLFGVYEQYSESDTLSLRRADLLWFRSSFDSAT